MFPFANANETPYEQPGTSSYSAHRYTEQEIQEISRDLVINGRQSWSENPRLYIILRDIGQIKGTNQPQLLDDLIRRGLNDFWIPITSDSILQDIFKPQVRLRFLQVQDRVCHQSTSFQIGPQNFHGNFATKEDVPFQRCRSIGRGRVGYVDEVLSLTDREVYARKSIRKLSYFEDVRRNIERFRCELQVLRRIRHRHCVQIIGSYTNPRHLAIIMSPVADLNLEEYLSLAEKSLAPSYAARIREWFGCLLTAVQYLHSNRIRHRDIKPANILVYGHNILLVDFELALDWKDLAQSTTTTDCGKTPLYAAPEVIQHKKRNSTSDIWSLGCVFLEMVTVLKGKSIAQLREHFTALTESYLFFNNHYGIQGWISLLENLSSIDNAPLLWISNMVRPDRALRSRAAAILEAMGHFNADGCQPNPYFGKCCQRENQAIRSQIRKCVRCAIDISKNSHGAHLVCTECTKTHQNRIYRNPEPYLGILPVKPLISFLHPFWMVQHLSQSSMKEFAKSNVAGDRWESFGIDVELLCFPWQPLYVNVRRYVPLCHSYSIQTHTHSKPATIGYSLPIGMYKQSQEATAKSFNNYLDETISYHLLEFAVFMQLLRGYDYSSKTLAALFTWLEQWKEKLPKHELHLIRNAIKLIAIQTILSLGLVLETTPAEFTNSPFPSHTGPQLPFPKKQTPRLLNRQIKVVFFAIYKSLLTQVLNGFKAIASNRKSWSSCIFVSICLAFLIERIETGSQEYILFSQGSVYQDKQESLGNAEGYCEAVESVVFARIYRVLGTVIKGGNAGHGVMELQDGLRRVRKEFDEWEWDEEWESSRVDVNVQHSLRLVSALLDLILHA